MGSGAPQSRFTFKSLSGPAEARIASRCRSWTIRPQKRRKVRGSRTRGFTLINTPLAVCTYSACGIISGSEHSSAVMRHADSAHASHGKRTLTCPALFSGLSSMASKACTPRRACSSGQASNDMEAALTQDDIPTFRHLMADVWPVLRGVLAVPPQEAGVVINI